MWSIVDLLSLQGSAKPYSALQLDRRQAAARFSCLAARHFRQLMCVDEAEGELAIVKQLIEPPLMPIDM
jgi:hypothetical protein